MRITLMMIKMRSIIENNKCQEIYNHCISKLNENEDKTTYNKNKKEMEKVIQNQSEQYNNNIDYIIRKIHKTARQNNKRDEKIEEIIMDHKDKIYELKQRVKLWKQTCKEYKKEIKLGTLKDENNRFKMRNLFLLEKSESYNVRCQN